MADIVEYAQNAPGGGGLGTKVFNGLFVGGIIYFLFFANREPKDPFDSDSFEGITTPRRRRRRRRNRR